MKFNIQSKTLSQQLQAVSKVINTKNALSILDNFLFEINGNILKVTGSDQENTVCVSMEVYDVDHDGAVAINAKQLLDRLKLMPEQGLNFVINDETFEIDINYLNGHYNFMGVDPTEYPRNNVFEEDAQIITLPAAEVVAGIENTIFAVSTDTLRPMMMGIYWDIHPEDITFVSSDTHKLVRFINRECKPGIERSFVMPAKPAAILRDVISKNEGDIKLSITSKNATFQTEDFALTCRFINGNYPAYNRVIPEQSPFTLTVDRQTLLNAMRRVSISASQASSLVKLDIKQNLIHLTAQDLDYSISSEENVECDYQGNDMVIGFKATFMIELLSNLKTDSIVIRLTDPARPGLFEPADQSESRNVLMLLMPMQTME